MRNILDRNWRENQNICLMFNIFFSYFSKNRAVCERKWKNWYSLGHDNMAHARLCWIPKATNTHTQILYYLLIFPRQK